MIIVRLCYLSANTTQAGTVECLNTIAHTERYRILRLPIQDGRALLHLTGNCNQELKSDNYHTLQVLDFEKAVCSFKSFAIYYEKRPAANEPADA